MIVQQILAAGGPGMELAARYTISIPPWLCGAALGHGAPGYSEHLALPRLSPLQEMATVRCWSSFLCLSSRK